MAAIVAKPSSFLFLYLTAKMLASNLNVVVDPKTIPSISADVDHPGIRKMRGLNFQVRSKTIPILGCRDAVRNKDWGTLCLRELAFSIWDASSSSYVQCDMMVSGRGVLLPTFEVEKVIPCNDGRRSSFGKRTVPSKITIQIKDSILFS